MEEKEYNKLAEEAKKKEFEKLSARISTLTMDDINKEWDEMEKYFKSQKLEGEELIKRTLLRLDTRYKAVLAKGGKEVELLLIGSQGIKDWASIARRSADTAGTPGIYASGFQKGKSIPEQDFELSLIALENVGGKVEQVVISFKNIRLRISIIQ